MTKVDIRAESSVQMGKIPGADYWVRRRLEEPHICIGVSSCFSAGFSGTNWPGKSNSPIVETKFTMCSLMQLQSYPCPATSVEKRELPFSYRLHHRLCGENKG
jgi:hypothetical protein